MPELRWMGDATMTDAVGLFLAVMVVLCCAAIWSAKALGIAVLCLAAFLAWLILFRWPR